MRLDLVMRGGGNSAAILVSRPCLTLDSRRRSAPEFSRTEPTSSSLRFQGRRQAAPSARCSSGVSLLSRRQAQPRPTAALLGSRGAECQRACTSRSTSSSFSCCTRRRRWLGEAPRAADEHGGHASVESGKGDEDGDRPEEEADADVEEAPSGSDASVLGCIWLVCGTAVGAGALALPARTITAGFGPSSAALVGVWAMLLGEGLLLAEVNVKMLKEQEEKSKRGLSMESLLQQKGRPQEVPEPVSLRTMAKRTLGSRGEAIVTSAYLFLSYAVIMAYISRLGEDLSKTFPFLELPLAVSPVIITALITWLFINVPRKSVDTLSENLTYLLFFAFGVLVMFAAGGSHWENLSASYWRWNHAVDVLPIAFLSLIYGKMIPLVCANLRGDTQKIRLALGVGSGIPLVMYIIWDAVLLAQVPPHSSLDPLEVFLNASPPVVAAAGELFSSAAIATSLLGNTLQLSTFFKGELSEMDLFGLKKNKVSLPTKNRDQALAMGLTLAPPLLFAMVCPRSFNQALDFAGAYCSTALFGVIPPLMAFKMRGEDDASLANKLETGRALVPGGFVALGSLATTAVAVAATHAVHDPVAQEVIQLASTALHPSSLFG